MYWKLTSAAVAALLLTISGSQAFAQQLPGDHPGYLHALSDLRAARWCLNHQAGDVKVFADENVGINETQAAINEIKRASIDDGKDLNDHPAVDVADHGSRLMKSIEFLNKAQRDIDAEEDNPRVRGMRLAAHEHIANAIRAANAAHAEWLRDLNR